MHVSLRWLNDYIDLKNTSVSAITEALTSIGLEVEGVRSIKPVSGPVVVGAILEAQQHPNADKLRLCQVDVGDERLTIVCGAANARAGLKVVVARIGATLPGDFKIKESKIRGEKSFGMLCSEQELGLAESSDGILELPADAPIGTSIAEYLALEDTVIEIGLTPNRSDCLGLIGTARDLGAKLNLTLKKPAFEESIKDSKLESSAAISVEIENADDSARFVALSVEGVKTIPSPQWMQRRLQHAGMRPINLIVDATNYAMLENGQPIHAYDVRDVRGKRIRVRRAKDKESLVTLDGQTRSLVATDIVIADAEQTIGLAGIMGGAHSEVKDDTTAIIIEVAQFNPSLVRKTSKRFALHTEASHRFERGIDLQNIPWVAYRVAQLIHDGMQAAGAGKPRIARSLVDLNPKAFVPKTISLSQKRLAMITAIPGLDLSQAASILKRLGFTIASETKETLSVHAPSWRHDMEREADLIEEVARIYGYEKIPLTLPKMQLGALPEHPLIEFVDQNKFALAQLGLNETISFPFMGEQDFTAFGISATHPLHAAVRLVNPLVEQHRFMRSTMLVGLVQAIQNNRRHGVKGARLFEIARTFHEPKNSTVTKSAAWATATTQGQHISARAAKDDRPIERTRAAGIFDHPFLAKAWDQGEVAAGFNQAKAVVTAWLGSFGIDGVVYEPIQASDFPWLHPGASAALSTAAGELLGYVGELHPSTAKAFDFEQAPIVFELDLETVLKAYSTPKRYASGSARFPAVTRDLALLVPGNTTYAAFMKSFVSFKRRKYLRDQKLFDVYQGPKLPEGKKSMAFSLQFQSDEKTLTDVEVEKEIEALLQWLKDDLSAELR